MRPGRRSLKLVRFMLEPPTLCPASADKLGSTASIPGLGWIMDRPKTAESVPMSAPLRETRKREQIVKRDFSGPAGTTKQGETAGLREGKKEPLGHESVGTASNPYL